MARMIPSAGPKETNSRGEKKIYALLKQGLSDEFTVIHSLPWIASAVKKSHPKNAPTGEVDFLIIHQSLGLLTLEIKGGAQRIEEGLFIYVQTGKSNDHLQQMRHNTHGLAKALGSEYRMYFRIGYALVVPDSEFGESLTIQGLVDTTVTPPQPFLIDRKNLDAPTLAARIHELMTYWKQALDSKALGADRMDRLVAALCPNYDGTSAWASRVEYDNRTWLRLTEEQASVVHAALGQTRMVVTGWPGTGKTLIATESARRLIAQGKRVLMLTFNALLVGHLLKEIGPAKMSKVANWHGFCTDYVRQLGKKPERSDDWREHGCLEDLQTAQEQELIPEFDVLILDEAQALRPEWCAWLAAQFIGKPIIAFCDETQRFTFEKDRISTEGLCQVFGVARPYALSIALRSPRNVFDHLQRVRLPSCQMSSPRDAENDTLQERVVKNMETALQELLAELTANGINRADIVILSKYGWFNKNVSAERYESVPRFRGMEAPVIIIVRAEKMNEIELFCAYSRATTLCIALFEAEGLGCDLAIGKFQELVLENPNNAQLANMARKQGLTSYLLDHHVKLASVGLTSVDLSWCEAWHGWFVDRQDDTEAATLWIDYLLTYHDRPVYSWTSTSRREIERKDPVVAFGANGSSTRALLLEWCDACGALTPHSKRIMGAAPVCQWCEGALGEQPAPLPEILALLKRFDSIICSEHPGKLPKEDINSLPLPLAALGARRHASARRQGVPDKLNPLPDSSILRRWSTAFIYYRICVTPIGDKIELDMLVQFTSRYVFPEGLTPKAWRDAISRSLGSSEIEGLLKKITKGTYQTILLG